MNSLKKFMQRFKMKSLMTQKTHEIAQDTQLLLSIKGKRLQA